MDGLFKTQENLLSARALSCTSTNAPLPTVLPAPNSIYSSPAHLPLTEPLLSSAKRGVDREGSSCRGSTFKLSSSTSPTMRRSVARHDWAHNLESEQNRISSFGRPSHHGEHSLAQAMAATQLLARQSLLGRASPGQTSNVPGPHRFGSGRRRFNSNFSRSFSAWF